ncbi:hypothetical protein TNCV_715111 [Trichonephila clavipes]|nr:hypothetical protein TNCV_715111 [Trichonephila clavipes]
MVNFRPRTPTLEKFLCALLADGDMWCRHLSCRSPTGLRLCKFPSFPSERIRQQKKLLETAIAASALEHQSVLKVTGEIKLLLPDCLWGI